MPSHTKPYGNILETIGWTPLVRLNRVTQGSGPPVYAKRSSSIRRLREDRIGWR